MISSLPDPPARILLIGLGCREVSDVLAKLGFDASIAGLSREIIKSPEGVIFDAAVFYRNAEYFADLKEILKEIREFLHDNGKLVLCNALSEGIPVHEQTSRQLSREITIALFENGFRILDEFEVKKGESDCGKCFVDHGVFVAKKDRFFIRTCREGDEWEIVPMFNGVFNTHRTMEHWYWKFKKNPFGSNRVCLGQSDKGKLVSHYAGYPLPFCSTLENADRPALFETLHAGDTFTHPSVRRIGLGKTGLLARTTGYFFANFLEGTVPFAFGFNTATIKKLGERYLGYRFADPVVCWEKDVSVWTVKRPGLFSRLLSGYDIEEVFLVDEAWDVFFDRVRSDYSFLVARDGAYVRWRYLECPDKVHRLFTLRRKGRLVGWSVFSRKDDRILWGDALFDRHHLKGVADLLNHVATQVFSGMKTMSAWFSKNPVWWMTHLLSLGFNPRPEPDGLTLCYISFENPVMDVHTITRRLHESFYYSWGDSDLF